MLSNFVFKIV